MFDIISKMMFKILSIVLTLSAVGYGIPLEDPSENMAKFFDSRIIGGIDAPEGYAPHMAALLVGTNYIFLACGASIVSPKLLLTAAHCIDAYVIWGELMPSFHGLVGTNTLNLNRQNEGLRVDFENHHIHPEWDWGPIKNDIGFLVMREPLTMSRNIQPIKMNLEDFIEEVPCYATGFGNTEPWIRTSNRLQLIYKDTITHEECVERINNYTGPWGTAIVERDIEICTFHSYGFGMCNGDSGSGLVKIKTEKFPTDELIGLVSWGFPCAQGVPDVFTRLFGYSRYISVMMETYR